MVSVETISETIRKGVDQRYVLEKFQGEFWQKTKWRANTFRLPK